MSKTLKPITEISNEDLLDIISENPNKINTYEYNNDVLEFISTYGIKEGENQILFPLIFNLYKSWSRKPLFRNNFGIELSKLFVSVKYGLATTYRINKSKDFFLEKSVKKKQNKTKRKPWLKHFQKFVDKFELKSGSFYIKDIVLYNIYDKWVYKNGKKNPLSFHQFLKFCNLFFKKPAKKIINGHEYFGMDKNIQKYFNDNLLELMKT